MVLEATYRSLGSLPQVLAFSEVYQALQTGVVDGGENTPSNIYNAEIPRGAKISHAVPTTLIGYALIVNRSSGMGCQRMSAASSNPAVKEATAYFNSIAEKENEEALAKIKASGTVEIHTFSPQEKSQ
jgi:C4-dicarboxylate-binding protein DctP